MKTALAHSVQVRLVQHSKKLGIDPNVVLVRYASERLLYRLSRSQHAECFVLKGALLLLVWLGETVIAEKLHAMVVLGAANSRMRDFFDVHALADFAGPVLLSVARGERFVGIWPPGGPWR